MFLEPTTMVEFLEEMKEPRHMRLWHNQLLETTSRTKLLHALTYARYSLVGGLAPEYRDWHHSIVFIVDVAETIQCPVGCAYCYVAVQEGRKALCRFLIKEEDLDDLVLALHQHANFRAQVFGRKTNILMGQKIEIGADSKAFNLTYKFLKKLLVNKNIKVLHYTKLPKPKLIARFDEFKQQLGWLVSLTNLSEAEGLEPGADPWAARLAQIGVLQNRGWSIIPYIVFMHVEEARMFAEQMLFIESDTVVFTTLRFFQEEKGQYEATEKILGNRADKWFITKSKVKVRLTTEDIKKIDSIMYEAAHEYGKTALHDRASVPGRIAWKNPTIRSDKPCANGNGTSTCGYNQKRAFCDGSSCRWHSLDNGEEWNRQNLDDINHELQLVSHEDGLVTAARGRAEELRRVVHAS